MSEMIPLILILVGLSALVILADFFIFLVSGRRALALSLKVFSGIVSVFLMPFFYLMVEDIGLHNSCCGSTATFAPEHTLTIYVWIGLGMFAFFYSLLRKELGSPIIEVLANIGLALGIVLNIVLLFHLDFEYGMIGNLPIILLLLVTLVDNQIKIKEFLAEKDLVASNVVTQAAIWILRLEAIKNIPIFFLLLLPLLVLVTAFLLLFGQSPDSSIRAFTETYYHGLSQWDYKCANVDCGGHYLCSVAANGHEQLVKPIRLGYRNGGTIVCNRQLLLSNAFEELMEERVPRLHRFIRKHYNRVGDVVHKYYGIFERKWVSDVIYILMKPLELIFWITLYTLDRNPENRIARQYLGSGDREALY